MKQGKRHPKQVYGVKQVAEIIEVEPWRVKNFVHGGGYGLAPSAPWGKQKRFTFQDVFRFALAQELVQCGFGPEAVGAAIKAVPDAVWRDWIDYGGGPDGLARFVLFQADGKWTLESGENAKKVVDACMEAHGKDSCLFLLNLSSFFEMFFRGRIEPYLLGDFRPEPLKQSARIRRGR
ncbi:MAG TPA: hypothetical protein VJQ82_04755 [Terriglobales bacterium]|nr:hypothetical protein [Terriglobales bacterium]